MTDNVTRAGTPYQDAIRNNVWMHMSPHQALFNGGEAPVIVRGEGHHIFDDKGKKYLDGLAGLFTVQVGHGREQIAKAMYDQTLKLPFMPLWSYAHPQAIEVSERLASYAPGDLNRVFLTSGGGDSVESAMKLAKNYFKLVGKPGKHKIISRATAYHGTPHGALSVTSLPGLREQFAPLVPGAHKVPNTNFYRAPEHLAHDEKAFGRWAADRIGEAIEFEGADSVAAVFLEPVQNSGGCFPPPPGYFERVREICDEYDVLLVSDETICAYGRIGDMFACNDFGYVPDIITSAKGITSGYAPLGAMIASDRLFEPFGPDGDETFYHGYTFGGHPVACAAAMANFDVFERRSSTTTCTRMLRRSSSRSRSSRTCRSSVTSAVRDSSTESNSSRTRTPRNRSPKRSPSGFSRTSCRRRCTTAVCTAARMTAATRSSSSRLR
jgi:adenosylmethionine-8-amino-7-oxononanoate aminotransferase